jgi:hypothetical protein
MALLMRVEHTMSVGCKICKHPHVSEINLALFNGGSVRVVAKQFGFTDFSAIARHSRKHLPNVLARTALETEAQVRAELKPELDAVLDALWTLYRELDVRGRQLCRAVIQQLEGAQHGDAGGMEDPDRVQRPRSLD